MLKLIQITGDTFLIDSDETKQVIRCFGERMKLYQAIVFNQIKEISGD